MNENQFAQDAHYRVIQDLHRVGQIILWFMMCSSFIRWNIILNTLKRKLPENFGLKRMIDYYYWQNPELLFVVMRNIYIYIYSIVEYYVHHSIVSFMCKYKAIK